MVFIASHCARLHSWDDRWSSCWQKHDWLGRSDSAEHVLQWPHELQWWHVLHNHWNGYNYSACNGCRLYTEVKDISHSWMMLLFMCIANVLMMVFCPKAGSLAFMPPEDEMSEVVSRCLPQRQLWVSNLSKVAKQWLEVDLILRPSGYKAQNIPLHHLICDLRIVNKVVRSKEIGL